MVRLKKLHLSLSAILLTATVMSAAQATVYDSKVRRHGGFYVEVEPFSAKATDSLLTRYPIAASDFDVTIGTTDFAENINYHFHPDYDWGYRVSVGYDFPSCDCCNYGFSLEYTRHNSDDHRNLTGFIENDFDTALFLFSNLFVGVGSTDLQAKYDNDFYAADLLGHKNMTVCKCVDVRWFAGARYVRLDQDWHQHFFVPEDLVDVVITSDDVNDLFIDHHNKFDGVGPHVGFNAFFPVFCNFGLTTEAAGDLLFGWTNSSYHEHLFQIDFPSETFNDFNFREDAPKEGLVVPGLSGKVGLAYRATFRNCSSFSVEVGYRGSKFFGIADHSAFIIPQTHQVISSFNGAFSKDAQYHDYQFSGPYITLSYHA